MGRGPFIFRSRASHVNLTLSPSLVMYIGLGLTVTNGGRVTITLIGVEGPDVPSSLYGVQV